MEGAKKIFICPLDWGLGHTTRCIPIAKELHKRGHEVFFGVNETQRTLLKKELEFAEFIQFEGYNIKYPKGGNMILKMIYESPKILRRIKEEKKELKYLIELYKFDLIISDNRFGIYSRKKPCIYITHQINIQGPAITKKQLHKFHGKFIKKFSQCWIPDSKAPQNLGGELSHGNLHKNCFHIGSLTRFTKKATSTNEDISYLAIISGPEPQRSEFERRIIKEFSSSDEKCAIIGGTPLSNTYNNIRNIEYHSHLNTKQFYDLVCRSEKIISRSGYSTIMDFSTLQKPLHFIPTPGQTEQEYLAKLHGKDYGWSTQRNFKLTNDLIFNYLPEIEQSNFSFLDNL